ncbi:hypothetical protein JXD38_10985 [candidate division WOR-3 bacterium]|nr:hypothetical protein [candidate division WOR-3 bacterium]
MRVRGLAVAALLFCTSLAGAWYWDVRQIDSAGWGASVEMRWQPDSQLVMCYSDTLGNIRLTWPFPEPKYLDLPHWRSVIPGSQAFDVDSDGVIGVSYVGTDGRNCYAIKNDTSWTDAETPFYPYARSPTTIDTAGNPVISFQSSETLMLARKQDTQWVTTMLMTGDASMNPGFSCCDLGSKADGTIWGVFCYYYSWPWQKIYGTILYSFEVQDSQTNVVTIKGGAVNQVYCASGCVDHRGGVHASYGYWQQAMTEGLFLDASLIDSTRAIRTAVRYDTLGRPQIAYVTWYDTLMFRYHDPGIWRVFNLQTTGLRALTLAIDKNQEPLIAYTTRDGLFLARGVGVTGQGEERRGQMVYGSRSAATVVSRVLFLPSAVLSRASSLFSLAGRKVMDLKPGANDVSALSPGVYFVVTPSPFSSPPEGERVKVRGRSALGVKHQASSVVTKVIIAE